MQDAARYPRGRSILGLPMETYRKAVSGAWEHEALAHAAGHAGVSVHELAACADHAVRSGLATLRGDHLLRPTQEGLRLSRAVPFDPLPPEEIRRLVDIVTKRATAFNAQGGPILVTDVWLHGPAVEPGVPVDRLDFAVNGVRAPGPPEDSASWRRRLMAYAEARTGKRIEGSDPIAAMRARVALQDLLMPRKSSDAARAVQSRLDLDLCDRAEPCRRVFDAARGGAVDDPVLDRHPNVEAHYAREPNPRFVPEIPDMPACPVSIPLAARVAVETVPAAGSFRLVDVACDWPRARALGVEMPYRPHEAMDGRAVAFMLFDGEMRRRDNGSPRTIGVEVGRIFEDAVEPALRIGVDAARPRRAAPSGAAETGYIGAVLARVAASDAAAWRLAGGPGAGPLAVLVEHADDELSASVARSLEDAVRAMPGLGLALVDPGRTLPNP